MAIYAGTWTDGAGVPFDPYAIHQANPRWPARALGKRKPRRKPANLVSFPNMGRYAAHRYWYDLEAADRQSWKLGPQDEAATRSLKDLRTANHFLAMSCFTGPTRRVLAQDDTLAMLGWHSAITAFRLDSASVASRTIDWTATLPDDWPATGNRRLVIYMVNPAYTNATNIYQFARIVQIMTPPGAGPGEVPGAFHSPWPLHKNHAITCIARSRGNRGLRIWSDDTIFPT